MLPFAQIARLGASACLLGTLVCAPLSAEASDSALPSPAGSALGREAAPALPEPAAPAADTVSALVRDASRLLPEPARGILDPQPAPSPGAPAAPAPASQPGTTAQATPPGGARGRRGGGSSPVERRRAPTGRQDTSPGRQLSRERDGTRAAAGASAGPRSEQHLGSSQQARGEGDQPLARVTDVVNKLPESVKVLIAALAVCAILFGGYSLLAGLRGRRLGREREQLLRDSGALHGALLPSVPERVGPLSVSVAYRPADGPAAGGDFYDVFPLDEERVAMIVGDVSGHGRTALARATLMHYTLRAYLEAGLPPRLVLQLAGQVRQGDGEGEFATAVVAVYHSARGTLTYACAGHPPPVVLGLTRHKAVTACSSPPVGFGLPTGLRQTTLALPPGSVACFYTDGVIEARVGTELLGEDRLAERMDELGPAATAPKLLDWAASEAGRARDDMAACVIRPLVGSSQAPQVVEELEVRSDAAQSPEPFLAACGIAAEEAEFGARSARQAALAPEGAILRVITTGDERKIEVVPADVERLPSRLAMAV
jgi:hypothetical protein